MNKLKFVIPVLLLTALVLVGASCGEKERKKSRDEEEEKYLTYENEKWGFEIDYPEEWEKKTIEEEVDGIVVGFRVPAEDKDSEEEFRENVLVLVGKAIPNEDFDQLMEQSLEDLPEMPGVSLIDYSKVEVADYPSYKVIYTELFEATLFKYLHYFINADDLWCQILYLAKEENYSEYLKEVKEMVKSFKID